MVFFILRSRPPPRSTRSDALFPDTTLFRSPLRPAPVHLDHLPSLDRRAVDVTLAHHVGRAAVGAEAVRGERVPAAGAPYEQRGVGPAGGPQVVRSEENTSETQALMRKPHAVFCLTKKHLTTAHNDTHT